MKLWIEAMDSWMTIWDNKECAVVNKDTGYQVWGKTSIDWETVVYVSYKWNKGTVYTSDNSIKVKKLFNEILEWMNNSPEIVEEYLKSFIN